MSTDSTPATLLPSGAAEQSDPSELHRARLHGHEVRFRLSGSGPWVVLIHGITGNSEQWVPVMRQLRDRYTLFAPDLLGHGESAKPRGDYSLGAYASGVRDLLIGLGADRATVVGHSLGGGIAMQFVYQFPRWCGRLVLVSSGGIARDVHPVLRAASLPGSELVLPLITSRVMLGVGGAIGRALSAVGVQIGEDLVEGARGYASLGDRETRAAFLHTIRAVIDPLGQRISALDRLYLAEAVPSMIIWGSKDPIIPSRHGRIAEEAMPGGRLELMEGAGHFPQITDPERVAGLLADFIEGTEAAEIDAEDMRELMVDRNQEEPDGG